MKLKLSAFLTFITLLFCFIGCEKEKEDSQVCKIVKEAWIKGTDTTKFNYSYNSDGKLTRIQYDVNYYTTYTYASNKVTVKIYENNVLKSTEVVTLSSEGLAVSSTYTLTGALSPKSTTEFDFDDDGYLVSKTITSTTDANDIQTYTYEYEDGNLVLQTNEHEKTGYRYYSETTYEYYADKRNTYDLSVGFYGKPCKNLVKKSTLSATLPVALTFVTSYTYEMESNGNVKAVTVSFPGSSSKVVPGYECK